MMSGPHLPRPMLLVRFPPNWLFIEPLRLSVDQFAKLAPAPVERAGIVVQELLENAIKYGDPSEDVELRVELDVGQASRWLEVRVINHAHRSRLAILEKEFERLAGGTATEAFAKALERVKRLPQGTSMLGLSRIAVEASLKLEVVGDRAEITARVA